VKATAASRDYDAGSRKRELKLVQYGYLGCGLGRAKADDEKAGLPCVEPGGRTFSSLSFSFLSLFSAACQTLRGPLPPLEIKIRFRNYDPGRGLALNLPPPRTPKAVMAASVDPRSCTGGGRLLLAYSLESRGAGSGP